MRQLCEAINKDRTEKSLQLKASVIPWKKNLKTKYAIE